MISAIKTSDGHWIKVEVWETEKFELGEAHNNSPQNRRDRQKHLSYDIKQFLAGDVKTGDHKEWENYGIKVRVDVLDRKEGGHSLGQYDTTNILYYLLPRILGAIHEKSKKVDPKRNNYAKWWLVLTINDGDGGDLSIEHEHYGDLWFWFLFQAWGWGEGFQKLGFEKIFLLDVKKGGYVEWHFDEYKMPLLTGINFGIDGWKPWKSDFIAGYSGTDLFKTGGSRWYFPPDGGPRKQDLLSMLTPEHPYILMTFSHHSGTTTTSRVLGELLTSLDPINSQGDLPTVKNAIGTRRPIISHPLSPDPLKIKRFILASLPEKDKDFFLGNNNLGDIALHRSPYPL